MRLGISIVLLCAFSGAAQAAEPCHETKHEKSAIVRSSFDNAVENSWFNPCIDKKTKQEITSDLYKPVEKKAAESISDFHKKK